MSEMYPVKVPDYIKKMSREELDREIARLEAEARIKREATAKEQNTKTHIMV